MDEAKIFLTGHLFKGNNSERSLEISQKNAKTVPRNAPKNRILYCVSVSRQWV